MPVEAHSYYELVKGFSYLILLSLEQMLCIKLDSKQMAATSCLKMSSVSISRLHWRAGMIGRFV